MSPRPIQIADKMEAIFNNCSLIDLNSRARLPFDGAVLEVHRGSGFVYFEWKDGEVYLDGEKFSLFLSEGQKGDGMLGYTLRIELEARGHNTSAKVLDHFVEHPNFWPEKLKRDAKGNPINVFFWDDIFRNTSHNGLCVRCGYWEDKSKVVVSSHLWLNWNGWGSSHPAASYGS